MKYIRKWKILQPTEKIYSNRAWILETAWNLIRGVEIKILKSGGNIVTVRIQTLPLF